RHIFASQRKMAELKSQTRLCLEDVPYGTKPANDFCIGSRHNERYDFISGHEILDQSRSVRKLGLNAIDLGDRDLPQRGIRRIELRYFPQAAGEFPLLE